MHPADFKRMSPEERTHWAYYADETEAYDWRLERVAHLCGLDCARLDELVECEDGWERHDKGYLHKVITVAHDMLAGER